MDMDSPSRLATRHAEIVAFFLIIESRPSPVSFAASRLSVFTAAFVLPTLSPYVISKLSQLPVLFLHLYALAPHTLLLPPSTRCWSVLTKAYRRLTSRVVNQEALGCMHSIGYVLTLFFNLYIIYTPIFDFLAREQFF
ncbi:hypothetical protein GGR58DRAFT_94599 [Xylaria digitata]|nr:hypothetical protein GGR58DRAFT_94599 [Xylaria digitata]